MKAAAIIVAAGAGRRFASKTPKQFLSLRGLPVYLWSVRAFKAVRDIRQIILVVPAPFVGRMKAAGKRHGFEVVAGGAERYDSVMAGLARLHDGIDLVAIHDGARPLVTPAVIAAALRAAKKTGASVVAVQSRDTVKEAPGAAVKRTIPRAQVWLAQTPQTFKRNVILAAYRDPGSLKKVTDDAQAVEASGRKVTIVPGDYTNIKITAPEDLEIAKLLLQKRKGF